MGIEVVEGGGFVKKYTNKTMAGKVAVVTGGAGGIGLACAKEILARGGHVMITDMQGQLDKDEFKAELASLLEKYGSESVITYSADVTNPEELEDVMLMAKAMSVNDSIDMLVNSAGVQVQAPVKAPGKNEKGEDEKEAMVGRPGDYNGYNGFSQVIDINLKGSFNSIFAALPYMKEGSSIVNMASVHAHVGSDQRAPYCASKHGLIGMTKSMAVDFADKGIRINTVSPAFIDTDLARLGVKGLAKDMTGKPVEEIEEGSEEYLAAEKVRLSKQDGEWIEMDQVTKATADLLDGSSGIGTGEDVLLDNGKYVSGAKENSWGIALFGKGAEGEGVLKTSIEALNDKVKQISEAIKAKSAGQALGA